MTRLWGKNQKIQNKQTKKPTKANQNKKAKQQTKTPMIETPPNKQTKQQQKKIKIKIKTQTKKPHLIKVFNSELWIICCQRKITVHPV